MRQGVRNQVRSELHRSLQPAYRSQTPFEERTKGERYEQQLQSAVLGDAADGGLESLEYAPFHGQPVKENDIQDDPADREKAGDCAERGCAQRHVSWHSEDDDGNQISDDKRNDRCDVSLNLIRGNENKKRYDWKCCRPGR